jgi:hypothetical protein
VKSASPHFVAKLTIVPKIDAYGVNSVQVTKLHKWKATPKSKQVNGLGSVEGYAACGFNAEIGARRDSKLHPSRSWGNMCPGIR